MESYPRHPLQSDRPQRVVGGKSEVDTIRHPHGQIDWHRHDLGMRTVRKRPRVDRRDELRPDQADAYGLGHGDFDTVSGAKSKGKP